MCQGQFDFMANASFEYAKAAVSIELIVIEYQKIFNN